MNDNKIDFSIFNIRKSILICKLLFSIISLLFIGTAIAFNNLAGLGNDPVSVFLDGVKNIVVSVSQVNDSNALSIATNLISAVLFVFILVVKRKYINIGTIVYCTLLGSFIGFGVNLYSFLGLRVDYLSSIQILSNLFSGRGINGLEFFSQLIISAIACLMLFFGLAILISVDIGPDPFTGLAMILSDFTKRPFKVTKVILDISFFVIGWILGGEVGLVTIIAALSGGPLIHFFVLLLKKTNLEVFNSESLKDS